jgi:hypothetical protein
LINEGLNQFGLLKGLVQQAEENPNINNKVTANYKIAYVKVFGRQQELMK